jgi:hypothetical protein
MTGLVGAATRWEDCVARLPGNLFGRKTKAERRKYPPSSFGLRLSAFVAHTFLHESGRLDWGMGLRYNESAADMDQASELGRVVWKQWGFSYIK